MSLFVLAAALGKLSVACAELVQYLIIIYRYLKLLPAR